MLNSLFSHVLLTEKLDGVINNQCFKKECEAYLFTAKSDPRIDKIFEVINLLNLQQHDQSRKYAIERTVVRNFCQVIGSVSKTAFPKTSFASLISQHPEHTDKILDIIRGLFFLASCQKATSSGRNPVSAYLFHAENGQEEIRTQISFKNSEGDLYIYLPLRILPAEDRLKQEQELLQQAGHPLQQEQVPLPVSKKLVLANLI